MLAPLPFIVIVLTVDVPFTAGMVIFSVYGPLFATTFKTTGPLMPQPT